MFTLPSIEPREHLLSKSGGSEAQHKHSSAARYAPLPWQAPAHSSKSQLAQLRVDEHQIQVRKFNIMRFGATWLRPPGVAKTLQSKLEDAKEQLEQLEMQRRDAEMRAQEQTAQHAAGGELEFDATGLADQEERDLDEDVPEAEPYAEEDADRIVNVTWHEEDVLQGSPTQARRATMDAEDDELDGRRQEERDLGMVGDLDDDVPEAGSYEHTDTEVEDDSGDESAIQLQRSTSIPLLPPRETVRFGTISLMSEQPDGTGSSFLESSPTILRRGARTNSARPRRS